MSKERLDAAKIKEGLFYVHYWEARERGNERKPRNRALVSEAAKAAGLTSSEETILLRATNLSD